MNCINPVWIVLGGLPFAFVIGFWLHRFDSQETKDFWKNYDGFVP